MEIKVGSKWQYENYIEEENLCKVIYVNDDWVVVEFEDLEIKTCCKSAFNDYYTPYVETYKWQKIGRFHITYKDDNVINETFYGDKDYELLYNYKKYRKQFDDVEFDDDEYVYYLYVFGQIEPLIKNVVLPTDLIFSTREHAKTFFKLARENNCL